MNYSNIEQICNECGITNYTVNPDGSVDVKGSVNLSHKNLNRLPLKFGKVSGNFYCYSNQLTKLEGCPTEVRGYFYCYSNKLTTLEGGPTEVSGGFVCSHNPLLKEMINNPKAFLKQINRDKLINELLEYWTNL